MPHRSEPPWATWSDGELLELRICDLRLRLAETPLQERVDTVLAELAARGFRFRPHFWLSDDWFSPDGVPGVALPFYLAHPRLTKLERSQVLEVEGGTREQCLRILRHEVGHALDNAYGLRRRRRRQRLFGPSSAPYPDVYSPKPFSRNYVLHLEGWYAQSHPDEDFAETFAVWLAHPRSWRRRYAGWPALKKLEYVDELMREIAPRRPLVTTRRRVDPLERLRQTLGEYYREKRERWGVGHPEVFDRDLLRLFSAEARHRRRPRAAAFLRRVRGEVRRRVREWTGTHEYTVDQVLDDMITRCQELRLRLTRSERETLVDLTVLVTVQTLHYRHRSRRRIAL